MAELALQGVSKTYSGHVTAIQDVNLTIQDQELVVLVGPSGCGKTTTLRLIAGLDDLSHGVIRIDGRSVNQVAPRDRNIAMVFQHSALYPHLTVYDNIAFGLRMRHGSSWVRRWWTRIRGQKDNCPPLRRQAIGQAVRQASRMLGLDHLLERKPHELSGGERQRVALGRAIVRQPAAFLFDEPLSHLDPRQRVEMREVIKRLHRRLTATMVYVTHDQAEAMLLGDRIAVMNRGRIQQVGTPRDLYERPANRFVARFVGEPAMNMITGWFTPGRCGVEGEGPCFVGGGLTVRLAELCDRHPGVGNGPVAMGVRPEHVWLVPSSAGKDGKANRESRRLEEGKLRERQQDARRDWCGNGCVTSTVMLGATTLVNIVVMDGVVMDGVVMDGVVTDGVVTDGVAAMGRAKASKNAASATTTDSVPSELTVALSTTDTIEVGSQVAIGIDSARVHWFDAGTGKNLNWAATSGGSSNDLPAPGCEP